MLAMVKRSRLDAEKRASNGQLEHRSGRVRANY